MMTPRHTTTWNTPRTQRAFTWAVRSTDIPFMEADSHDASADGCVATNCNDCGCSISKLEAVRSDRALREEQP